MKGRANLAAGPSSGGSSAAVAADLCLGATATDTGGSIRQPAALTGTVGIKPTYGRCSRWGIVAFASSLDQAGPIAKTVRDAAVLLGTMASYDPKDSTSVDAPVPDYEAALALEQAALGIIPDGAAREIAAHARVENVDIEAIAEGIRRIKHPLVPALKALQALCKPEHGEYVHFGPTTQDVLDTATMLQIRESHEIYVREMKAIGRALYRLAEAHRATPMVGRSHGVQALPHTVVIDRAGIVRLVVRGRRDGLVEAAVGRLLAEPR